MRGIVSIYGVSEVIDLTVGKLLNHDLVQFSMIKTTGGLPKTLKVRPTVIELNGFLVSFYRSPETVRGDLKKRTVTYAVMPSTSR